MLTLKRSWNRVSSSGTKQPSAKSQSSPLVKDLGNVIKAPLDKKLYKVVELQNGLKICLVSTCELESSKDSVLSKSMTNQSQLPEQEIKTFNKDLMKNEGLTHPQSIAPAASISWKNFPLLSPMKIPKLRKAPQGPASICVCVGAGSLLDPWETNGLAHLVEHLVFQGSKQYPEPNTLITKVYDNGGVVHAATHLEYTNYFFQCNAPAFEECVSILADGLTNPLLNKTAITKAIQEINSEYTNNQAQDINLMREFLRNLVASGHPLRKSCRGSKETLHKSTIEEEVIKWKQRYYRANYMTVCIQAPMSIKELERFAVKHFSDIPSCSSSWNWKTPSEQLLGCEKPTPYTKKDFQAAYFIAPLTQIKYLMITWALFAKFWKNYECKPLECIRLLLENTSKGGLKHYLRKKQWISEWGNVSVNRCWRDDYYRNSYCSMFELTVILTDKGYENKYEVVEAVFSYLEKLRQEGVCLRRFQEIQMNNANKFHYQNWEEMLQSGAEIAVNMQRVKNTSHLLTSMNLMTRCNPALIDEALCSMLPCTANFIFASPGNLLHCKETFPHSRIRYFKENISSSLCSYMVSTESLKDFTWPEDKHFMPREFRLNSTGETALSRIGTLHMDKELKVEYVSEKKISWVTPQVPSASIFVHFSSPTVGNCRVKRAILGYWTRLLCDRIVTHAGHQFDDHFAFKVEVVDDGITIQVAGPHCHLVDLLILAVKEFSGRYGVVDGIDGGREVAQNLILDLQQESTNETFDVELLSKDILSYIQYEGYKMQSEVKKLLLEKGYCETLLDFRRDMFAKVELHGCVTTRDLKRIVTLLSVGSPSIVDYSPPTPRASSFQNADRATLLPIGTRQLLILSKHPAHVSTVTTNFYQMDGWMGQHARRYVAVLHVLLSRYIFKQLITRQQLGYNISFIPLTDAPLGLCVTILTLSNKYGPHFVDTMIDLFFRRFYEKNLGLEKTRTFLKKRFFKGDEGDKLIVGLEKFYRDNLLNGGSNFRKLTIHLQGYLPETTGNIDCAHTPLQYLSVDEEKKSRMRSEGVELITDIEQFKQSLGKIKDYGMAVPS